MTDTCDRCHRPRAATYDDWCDECDSLGAREVTPSCGYGDYRDDFCTAARDAWQTAEIARLTAELASERDKADKWHALATAAQDEAQTGRWRTIGVEADPAPGQWCVLHDGDTDAIYLYRLVRACSEEWESAQPMAFWNRHHGDRWLPLPEVTP